MNSFSCILSYNYYDYKFCSLLKDGKGNNLHESTLVRQSLYFCLFFLLLLSLTVATLVRLDSSQGLSLVDQNGYKRVLGKDGTFCYKLLGLGWVSFILAWIINICFYAIHPSIGTYLWDPIYIISIVVYFDQLMSIPHSCTKRCSSTFSDTSLI